MQLWFRRACAVSVLVAGCAFAQGSYSVDMLKEAVRSMIKDKTTNDREIGQFLSTVKMRQKLDASTVEELQGEGAGPKTVAALKVLMATSSNLAPPPVKVATAPPPSYDDLHPPPPYNEQYKIIEEAREKALNYTDSLPNFICLQQTLRYYDKHYQPGSEGSWSQSDVLKARVSYNNKKEDYQLLGINDESTINKTFDSVGGAVSRGEFGSLLKEIFDPATHTEFHWLRWGRLNNALFHVYKYKVEQENSRWTVDYQHAQQVTPGYEGLVYVNANTKAVQRVTQDLLMPPSFPIQEVHGQLDYRDQDVGGQSFLLPTRSEVRMRHDQIGTRNVIAFRSYRRYSTETSISFADVDDAPPENTPEKPADNKTVKPPKP